MRIDHYTSLFDHADSTKPNTWKDPLLKQLETLFAKPPHGHFEQWLAAIEELSRYRTNFSDLNQASVHIGTADDISPAEQAHLTQQLKMLLPWRKGPFNLFGVAIDSEWRCDQKWQRVQSALPSLSGKTILDVGCGNGYYMLRMLGAGASQVIGVDPTLLFLAQYTAVSQNLSHALPAYLLPLPLEQLPASMNQFDVVFSMGVLYHRRDAIEHLQRLHAHLEEGGVLILETLIINAANKAELIPQARYAGMRNVWHIPSPALLQDWLEQCGFCDIQLCNIQVTERAEQRATAWTKNYSLDNFLDPQDSGKTIEGYRAPTRAIFAATKS